MKGFEQWYQNLSVEDITRLTTILIASMVATLTSSLVLNWGMGSLGQSGGWWQLGVSVAATAVYAGSAILVFAIRQPAEMRLVWQRLRSNKK
ncbi:MAG: hypothetical protein IPM39_21865 [Chloroflexi bacterium]|nr:hypothetical protein [Chloroflexota bacterium]